MSYTLVFGLAIVAISIVRLTRSDIDLLLMLLDTALGILWLGAGVWRWRFGPRKWKGDR
ncbi:hypothetical protein ACTJKO_16195 [Curtobacterium sp. 22159]|uniref:hypothetical protein n=1 Tax=Curtobacterium sp. 22159 TaxID=3453882 RepID=UPI003F83CF44